MKCNTECVVVGKSYAGQVVIESTQWLFYARTMFVHAVYASSTKDSDVIGLSGLARVCEAASPVPVVAIGGIQVRRGEASQEAFPVMAVGH